MPVSNKLDFEYYYKKKGFTAKELAKRLGIKENTFRLKCTNGYFFTQRELAVILYILDMSLEEFKQFFIDCYCFNVEEII